MQLPFRLEIGGTQQNLTEAPAALRGESGAAGASHRAPAIPIGEPVFFEKGKVILSEASRATIDRQAAFLRDNPKITVTIEGYSSEGEGAREGPWVLAQLRANQVRNALKERGVADSRIQTINHGTTKPSVMGDNEADLELNRRVVVVQN
jgi:peptidoglycan-associated lipoprotein